MPSRAQSKTTNDHEEIRRWAEERGAQPACVKRTGSRGDIGMLRLDFPGYSGEESLQPVSWDDWFEKFDERNLALVYQDTTAGGAKSNFNKLVSRESMETGDGGGRRSVRTRARASSAGSSSASKSRASHRDTGRSRSSKSTASSSKRGTAPSKSRSASSGRKSTPSKSRSSRTSTSRRGR